MTRVSFIFSALLLLGSSHAYAQQFSVAVDVNKTQQSLTITEKISLKLPQVKVDKTVKVGSAVCASNHRQHKSPKLCNGSARNGVFEVKGKPNSAVQIILPVVYSRSSGLRLDLYTSDTMTKARRINIGANGRATFEVTGIVTVEDTVKVNNAQQVFDFEIQATYF